MTNDSWIYQVEDLQLIKGKKTILDIKELRIREGEVLALVGPNGAGKTSLLLTLALLCQPNRGQLKINQVEVTPRNILQLRRQMAVVFQEALLLDTSVIGNVCAGLKLRGVPARTARRISMEWLDRMGVAGLSERSIFNLSGGEAQRVNLARALALQPKILLMDEPFAAVDYPTRCALLQMLEQILKETKITTIFATHDYMEIPALAQRVGVLRHGRLIKCGSVEEIFGILPPPAPIPIPWENY